MHESRISELKKLFAESAEKMEILPSEITVSNDPKYARLSAKGIVMHAYDDRMLIDSIDDVVSHFKAEGFKILDSKAVDKRVFYVMVYDTQN